MVGATWEEMLMKWNIFLVIASAVMLLVFVMVGLTSHMMQAEAIAETLAPRIGVDEDAVRGHLELILRNGRVRRTAVYCSPLALLTILLTVRLIADTVQEN